MNVVGGALPRLDAISKVTGQAKYCDDIFVEGALYGAILRSPHAHANILRVDATKAKKLPGVAIVVTAADTAKKRYGHFIQDEYLLATDKVRFIGDEVAAVAAINQETAEEALETIEVVYEKLPEYMEPSEALRPGSQAIHESFPNNIAEEYVIERGNIAAGFAESSVVLEETFILPRVNACYLELTTCIASIDGNDKLTVWAPSGSPFRLRDDIAQILDLEPSKVRVITPTLGGNFGARHVPKNALIAALLALKTKRSVRIEASRVEEFILARPRVPATIKLKVGFARDGAILAKQTEIIAENGAYTCAAPLLLETMAQRVDSLYRIFNVHTKATLVYTNRPATGAFRGFGNPQMHFAFESMLDMAGQKLGIDPLVLRRKNATQKGDITVHGWDISSCGLTECIDKVRQETDWDSKRVSWPREESKRGSLEQKRRGIGMACMIHVAGRRVSRGFWGSTARVKVLSTGKVMVISGEADVGQGSNTAFAQIAAEELEMPLDAVEVAPLDTDNCPYALGSFSDRVTVLGGSAVRLAAADLKRKLILLAAKYYGVNETQVVYERGMLYCKGFGGGLQPQGVDILSLMGHFDWRLENEPIVGMATYAPENVVFRDERRYGNNNAAYTFAAQVAEVEVNVNTGQIKLLNLTSAHDLGRIINLLAAEGQVEGALAQGSGYALTEEMVFSDGRITNPNFLEYKLPTACDTLLPKVFLIESNEPHGPFGAKGVAEPGLVPTAPAIANAIYHAVGIRVTSLPITPDKVLAALEKQRKEGKTI
jgi:CO/xanthine dehydrogenase Mo-binding subunit